MSRVTEIDAVRREAILSSLAGFPFLIVFGFGWNAAAVLSYVAPPNIAPWIYVFQGIPAMPIAMLLERRMGYVRSEKPSPLLPLTLQILFVQIVAFPANLLVWNLAPSYLPVALAAIVGAHFLPFSWVYRTPLYIVLGILVAVGPYVLAVILGEDVLHYTGFFVGSVLLVGAFLALSHARATWSAAQLDAAG